MKQLNMSLQQLLYAKVNSLCLLFFACLLSSCGLVPGIKLDEPPRSKWFPLGRDERAFPPPEIVPITADLILQTEGSSQSAAPARPLTGSKLKPVSYRLGPGDAISIVVYEHPELSNPLGITGSADQSARVIREDGTLFFPYVGVMQVAGKTTEDLRQILTAELRSVIISPQVEVQVVNFRSQQIFVTGEINTPGVLPITDRPLTFLEAIERSGGFTDTADKRVATLIRNGAKRSIDLLALYGDGEGNFILRDGDVLNVRDNKGDIVYVMGEVTQQAVVPMDKGRLSLARALADSRGLTLTTADTRAIYVLRAQSERDAAGQERVFVPRVYHLDARAAPALLLAERFPLEPRDIVFVSAPGVVHWGRSLNQIFPSFSTLLTTIRIIQ